MVEVQKPMVFFAISAVLAQPSRGRGVLTTFVVRTGPRELSRVARCNLHFTATYAEQLAQSNLHRAACRATCRERNLHRATCRDQLAGATCAEQLAQSNLRSATCVEQLAQTNLHRPVCAEHLAWCCLALASRSVGKKNASCSVGPTSLAMFCFRANRGLVFFCEARARV